MCAQHTAPGWGHGRCPVFMSPELEDVWPSHPTTLRAGTCHSWPRALPNTSEKSHEFVGAGNREKAGSQSYSDFGAYGVRIEFRKSSWMCALSQRATHLFLPPSLCIWPSIPTSDDHQQDLHTRKPAPLTGSGNTSFLLWSESPFL